MSLRRLSPADAALFRAIRLEGLTRDPDAFSSTFEEESERALSFFAERLAASAVFAACRGPDLLGVAGFYVQPGPKHRHKGTLWGMYVRPQARGAGVGARLIDAVLEHARAYVELVELTVISENQAARRLYRRFGFEEYGLEKRAAKYRGRYHDDVLMAKMLSPEGEPGAGPSSGERRKMIPRYSRPEMAAIWEPENRFRIWLDIEAYACEAQAKLGVIPESAARAVREKGAFEVARIDKIERETRHDVIAFLTNVAEHVGPEARFMHQGMTSSDVLDTCLAVQLNRPPTS